MDQQEVTLETLCSDANVSGTDYDPAVEKSWYILTILARIGRPSTPEEISERCRFICVTPAEVLHLCCIPSSPLCNVDGRITRSPLAVRIFEKFCSKPVLDLRFTSAIETINELPLNCSRKRLLEDLVETDTSRQAKKVRKLDTFFTVENCRQPRTPSPLGRDPSNIPTNLGFGAGGGNLQGNGATGLDDGAAKGDEVLSVDYRVFKGVGAPGVDNGAAQGDVAPGVGDREAKYDVAPETGNEAPTSDNKINSLPLEAIIMKDVVETEAVDVNMADATAQTENCLPPMKPMQSSGCPDGKCDVKKDHFVTYKRQKGEMSKTQLDCMDKEGVFHSDTCKMDLEICSAASQHAQTSTQHDGIQTIKLEDKEVKRDQVTLAGDDVLSLQVNKLPKKQQVCANNEKTSNAKQKIKKSGKAHALMQEEMDTAVPTSNMNDVGLKRIPMFESFNVEEEEGSGGYGTVYKARRKQDGKLFAIKCPLEKTSSNYVTNEIKMLERFGGKNFIIKYEGAFKDNDCDCLILQHVEHEKPEVLRREIDVPQLRWYGYCMFKALQTLHKQGIIHRDVKPGNFLFSRKLNKGYLIDFNLALDQYDPFAGRSKPKMPLHNQKSVVAVAAHKPPFYSSRRDIPNVRHKALIAGAEATNLVKQTKHAHVKSSSNAINLKRRGHTLEVRQHDSSNHRAQSNLPPDTMNTNHKSKLGGESSCKKIQFCTCA
ncbi:hypothetical protein KI387_031209, partial [Taxus chinensis]